MRKSYKNRNIGKEKKMLTVWIIVAATLWMSCLTSFAFPAAGLTKPVRNNVIFEKESVNSAGKFTSLNESTNVLQQADLIHRWQQSLITSEPSFSFYTAALFLHLIYFSKELFGPVLSSIVRLLFRILVRPLISFLQRFVAQILPSEELFAKQRAARNNLEHLNNDLDSFAASEGKGLVKSVKEDKKSLKGDRRDIDRLMNHGYQKHRFVSKEFLQRNNLVSDNDDMSRDETESVSYRSNSKRRKRSR